MTHRSRTALRALTAAAVCAVPLLGGCAAPSGLAEGDAVPAVAAQPSPAALWPAWSDASSSEPGGAAVAGQQPAPRPLAGVRIPAGGLAALDVREVVRADPKARACCDKPRIDRPGRAGVRPPVLHDLTGDGHAELVVAADLESGRSAVAVYRARGELLVPVLYTTGRRLAVEAVGTDLLVRGAADDGAEQAVRYRWDGERLSTVSDIKNYPEPSKSAADGESE
ncbi:FG-GAP repeat protein [Streptomyces sp. NPDC050504]|uniref:FG-GAP repeat protein n=1 Tax=Streptomyces sp. NPDC050504 TaxID=3365618 RepID=UPI00379F36A3